ncbi:glycosyltransferase family 25 protein [Holospora curviuscula]|uniref:Glycosyltransferase family 25 (LPS biosynthesis protein) n=1 Tax=Holospora curviuscula TaxID=1082868 RepID=A0A2S5R8U0_9PROT|nr:glycosyltransferase family 25 protein [Holospora curviuscula]PPE03717.1 Glycosyltransferase family 25 (LPS biosynthesis protein) [Holospora curviuscula]
MFKCSILKIGLALLWSSLGGVCISVYLGGFVLPGVGYSPVSSLWSGAPYTESSSVGVYVINLDQSKARWQRIQHHLSTFPFPVHRISGIYGKSYPALRHNPNIVDLEHYRLFLKGKEPGLGEIGCYLSHCKALREFIRSSFAFAVIVEDDVTFSPTFPKIIEGLIRCKEKWDLCTFELHPLQSGWPFELPSASLFLPFGMHLCIYLKECWRAGAYLINRWAAHRLLERALPMRLPWDMYYMRFWEFKDFQGTIMQFTGIEPRCAFQTFGDSDIEKAGPRQITRTGHIKSKYRWYGRYFSFCSHLSRFMYGLWIWVRCEWKSFFPTSNAQSSKK